MRISRTRYKDCAFRDALLASFDDADRGSMSDAVDALFDESRMVFCLSGDDGTPLGMLFVDESGHVFDAVSQYDMSDAADAIERRIDGMRAMRRERTEHVRNASEEPMPATNDASAVQDWKQQLPDDEANARTVRATEAMEQHAGSMQPSSNMSHEQPQGDGSGRTDSTGTRHMGHGHVIAIVLCVIAVIMVVVFSVCIVRGTFGSDGTQQSEQDSGFAEQISADDKVTIVVSDGDTLLDVKQSLGEAGMVDAANSLYKILEEEGKTSLINTGTYVFSGSETPQEVADRLVAGQHYPDGYVGVNDGDTLATISKSIGSGRFSFTSDDFDKSLSPSLYVSSYAMLAAVPQSVTTVEGFIPSGTYDLSGAASASDAVRLMLDAGERRYEASGLSPQSWYDDIRIASMIDKEIIYDDERATVSSVIYNRLAQGMSLQIDATVLYALGRSTGIPTLNDVAVDSPYNTYKYAGLPIGPICSGISDASLDAAEHPATTNYLYYCLKPENDGHHNFASTYEQHAANQQAYEAATSGAGNSPSA